MIITTVVEIRKLRRYCLGNFRVGDFCVTEIMIHKKSDSDTKLAVAIHRFYSTLSPVTWEIAGTHRLSLSWWRPVLDRPE
jgi:hypothetical protein